MFHGNNENKSLKFDLRCDLILKPRSLEWSISAHLGAQRSLAGLGIPHSLTNIHSFISVMGLTVVATTPLVNHATEPAGLF